MKDQIILYINTADLKIVKLSLIYGKKIKKINLKSEKSKLSSLLLQYLDKFLCSNGVTLDTINGIVVYRGPGSYTSLRIGISVANALSWGLNIPIIGIKNSQKLVNINFNKLKNKNFKPVNAYYQQPK